MQRSGSAIERAAGTGHALSQLPGLHFPELKAMNPPTLGPSNDWRVRVKNAEKKGEPVI
jgi:hypothetical protein